MVDWGEALQIGGFGFLRVILTLGALSLALWLISKLIVFIQKKSKAANAGKNDRPVAS